MSRETKQSWLYDLAVAPLMLAAPLVVFLRYNGYSMLRGEVLLAFLFLAVVGLLAGIAMRLGRTPGRVLLMALLGLVVLDLQTSGIGLGVLAAAFLGFGVIAWLLRRHIAQIVTIMAAGMLLSGFLTPAVAPMSLNGNLAPTGDERADLPFILHIILDEHIGVEGFPAELDPNRAFAGNLRDFYLDHSFEVYGRAYSRYGTTDESVSNLCNFSSSDEKSRFFATKFKDGQTLAENAWFDLLEARGYRIHAIQSDYVHYLETNASPTAEPTHSSHDYVLETIKSLEGTPLPTLDRTRFILTSLSRLSFLNKLFRIKYTNLRYRLAQRGIDLPALGESYSRTSTLAAKRALDQLQEDLRFAGPGRMFLAHLMIPHYPYVYLGDGRIRADGREWLFASDPATMPQHNDTESRALRYKAYAEQLQYVYARLEVLFEDLRRAGLWDSSIIIIHGDHGSRISRWVPKSNNLDHMEESDYVDFFSTLFAVKRPGVPGRYDRRLLPIDHIFSRLMRDGTEPGDSDLENRPTVLMRGWPQKLHEVPLPVFGFTDADQPQ